MADEAEGSSKTEEPSGRRIQRARAQGQVALSREAVGFATLLGAGAGLLMLLPGMLREALLVFRGTLARSHELAADGAAHIWAWQFLGLVVPIAGCTVLGAVAATLLQTRGVMALSLLKPQFARINPLAAVKRMFGPEGWTEFGKSLLKIGLVTAAVGWVAGDVAGLSSSLSLSEAGLLSVIGQGARTLLFAALGIFALMGGADIFLARRKHLKGLRMTRQEVKDEMKESEGDPMVRARQRMLRETRGRQRMLSAVPTATVVITNPTHYAVALLYEPENSSAPRVVAKGADLVAARIRELAVEAGVPLLPNPPLARALWRLDVDTEIPAEHWEAVAEIIAFVLRKQDNMPGPAR